MCYYNNQFINSNQCYPKCNLSCYNRTSTKIINNQLSQNFASITSLNASTTLSTNEMLNFFPINVVGDSISVPSGSTYISLLKGTYFINYSLIASVETLPNDIFLSFTLNNSLIESSTLALNDVITSPISLSKGFLLNVVDNEIEIAFQNLSTSNINISNYILSIIKVGE